MSLAQEAASELKWDASSDRSVRKKLGAKRMYAQSKFASSLFYVLERSELLIWFA